MLRTGVFQRWDNRGNLYCSFKDPKPVCDCPQLHIYLQGKAFELAEKCKDLDDELDTGHMILGNVYLLKREYGKAIFEGRRAVELNPNSPAAAIFFGQTLRYTGKYEDAVREYERAIRLNPLETAWPLTQLGLTHVIMGRHEEAIVICKEEVQHRPKNFVAHITLAMD